MIYKGKKYRIIVNDKYPGRCFGCIFEADLIPCINHPCIDNCTYHWYVYCPTLNNNIKVI